MGFFDKIFGGLTKTRLNLEDLEEIFQSYKPDNDDFYDELEELLVMSDVGAATAATVVQGLKKMTWERRFRYGGEAREGLIPAYIFEDALKEFMERKAPAVTEP